MNTEEPKITLPVPPSCHAWEYRGMGWDPKRKVCYAYHSPSGFTFSVLEEAIPVGVKDFHYWEAVQLSTGFQTGVTVEEMVERTLDSYTPYERMKLDFGLCGVDVEKDPRAALDWMSKFCKEQQEEIAQLKDWKKKHSIEAQKVGLRSMVAELGLPENAILEDVTREVCQLKRNHDIWRSTADGEARRADGMAQLLVECCSKIDPNFIHDPKVSRLPDLVEGLKAELGKLRIDAAAKDMQIALLTRDRDYWQGRCAYLEAAAKPSTTEPDHTEGGKYRMLEKGEVIEDGDEVRVPGGEWLPYTPPAFGKPVRHDIRARRPEKPAPPEGCVWVRCEKGWVNDEGTDWITRGKEGGNWMRHGSQSRCADLPGFITFRAERIDFAHQAKALLQNKFGGQWTDYADQFVDLIIKAAKQ